MKVRNSLKSLRARHRENRIVRRKGRVYVINKTQRRFKAPKADRNPAAGRFLSPPCNFPQFYRLPRRRERINLWV